MQSNPFGRKSETLKSNADEQAKEKSVMRIEFNNDKDLSHWAEYRIEGTKISRRCYHSSVFVDKYIYVYGGYEINQGVLRDFYRADLSQERGDKEGFSWEEVVYESKINPGPLCRHTAVAHENKMYLLGGQINSFENTNQFIFYDFEKKEWDKVAASYPNGSFPSIDSHTANLWQKGEGKITMIVFGGFFGGKLGDYSNAVFEYDFEAKSWNILFDFKKVESEDSKKVGIPQGRMSHGAAIHKNTLYICGGFDGDLRLNDIWKFDLVAKTWSAIETTGVCPEARNGHSLVCYKENLILFGGIHDITHEKNDVFLFSVANNTWNLLETETKFKYNEEERSRSPSLKKDQPPSTKNDNKAFKFDPKPSMGDKSDSGTTPRSRVNKNQSIQNLEEKSPSKQNKYTKMKLASIDTMKTMQSPKSQKNILSPSNNEFKSSLQVMKLKDIQMKKNALLKEFEIPDDKKDSIREPTPLTLSMKKLLEGLGTNIENTEPQRAALEQTKEILSKNRENLRPIKTGSKPCARDGHSVAIQGSRLIIFAGDRHKMSFNDLFVLDLEKL